MRTLDYFVESIIKINKVHKEFEKIPFGNTLAHYLVNCFFHSPNLDTTELEKIYSSREFHSKNMPIVNAGQRDIKILQTRNKFLRENDIAYILAYKQNPTLNDIVKFSELGFEWWSILIAVKAYLIHHPEIEKEYKGFLPCGAPIAKYISKITTHEFDGKSLQQQMYLNTITINLANKFNMSTCEINTLLYIEGSNLLDVRFDGNGI